MTKATFTVLVPAYIAAKDYEGLSYETLTWYRKRLGRFVRWLDETGQGYVEPHEVSIEIVQEFAVHLRQTPGKRGNASMSMQTVKGYMQTIKGLYTWLEDEGHLGDHANPLRRLRMPKVPQKVIPALENDQTAALIAASKRLGSKEYAVMALFLDAGLRIGEVTRLTLESGINGVRYGVVRVYGKGAKERDVPIGKEASQALRRYIFQERPDTGSPFLFVSRKTGDGMTAQGIRHLVRRVGDDAGIVEIWPHLLRHTSALMFINNGGGEFALQRKLGHTTLAMTRRYTNLSTEDVKRAHDLASPLDNLRNSQGRGRQGWRP